MVQEIIKSTGGILDKSMDELTRQPTIGHPMCSSMHDLFYSANGAFHLSHMIVHGTCLEGDAVLEEAELIL